LFDIGDYQAVHARRLDALITRHPVKRHDQRRRVMHEVERVIKPVARISRGGSAGRPGSGVISRACVAGSDEAVMVSAQLA
jgi:hypothetical protein